MTNPAYEATNSDVEKLINSEIADFFAGIGQPGEPETPQEMQQQLQSRISAIFNAAPNGMMQLSNELAEMKRKCEGLEVACDRNYIDGMKTGWNYCDARNSDGFNKCIEHRRALISAGGSVEGE